jgi:heat shock protein HslJ
MTGRRILALLAVAAMVAGCSTASAGETSEGSGGELGATQWVLQSYAVSGALTIVPEGQFVDANFASGRVFGYGGCNTYDAVYRGGGLLLLVSMPATTLRLCDDAANELEQTYLQLLQQSRFYNVHGRTLTIRGADRSVILVYEAAPNNPLLGKWLVDSYSNASGAIVAPVPDSDPSVVFGLRDVSGTTGCNSFVGSYMTNGDVVAIGPLASTRMACAEALGTQDTELIAALQGVGRVEYRGVRVTLTGATGGNQVFLIRPSAVPAPSASPSASAAASASAAPSASATASPTAKPSPTPTATPAPTPTATAAPTATPAPTGTPAPTVKPPASVPPTATCTLNATTGGTTVPAAIVSYPANWFTVTSPANLACRYFDPAQITVPSDPSTLQTAVMIQTDPASTYEAALAAATNPTAWNVLQQQPATVGGQPATKIEATSTAGSQGYPPGVTRYGYLLNVAGKAAWIVTSGTLGSAAYTTNTQVVDLMASKVTFPPTVTPF